MIDDDVVDAVDVTDEEREVVLDEDPFADDAKSDELDDEDEFLS